MKTLLLLSGGLDSTTLLYRRHAMFGPKSLHCLLFDYKQRHRQELLWAKQHCARLEVEFTTMDLPDLGGLTERSWVVPNRNAIFLSVAVNVAQSIGAGEVMIGCNADDAAMFPDCRMEFIEAMRAVCHAAGYRIGIEAPLVLMTKREIAEEASKLGIRYGEVWTCYKGGLKPCGRCPACVKFINATK